MTTRTLVVSFNENEKKPRLSIFVSGLPLRPVPGGEGRRTSPNVIGVCLIAENTCPRYWYCACIVSQKRRLANTKSNFRIAGFGLHISESLLLGTFFLYRSA